MPNSLKCKIKHLRHNGTLTERECDRILKALEQEPVLDKIKTEIKEWYWQADKQALSKDPCVVDAMIDLFIRTINKCKAESEVEK